MIGSEDPEYAGQRRTTRSNAATEMFMYANELAAKKRAKPGRRHHQRAAPGRGRGRAARPTSSSTCSSSCSRWPATRRRATSSRTACRRSSRTPTSGRSSLADRTLMPTARSTRCCATRRRSCTCAAPRSRLELRGQTIKQGDKVALWYIAANRDDEVFDDPHTLRHHPARRTTTWRSAAAARTSASARTWPSSRSG